LEKNGHKSREALGRGPGSKRTNKGRYERNEKKNKKLGGGSPRNDKFHRKGSDSYRIKNLGEFRWGLPCRRENRKGWGEVWGGDQKKTSKNFPIAVSQS